MNQFAFKQRERLSAYQESVTSWRNEASLFVKRRKGNYIGASFFFVSEKKFFFGHTIKNGKKAKTKLPDVERMRQTLKEVEKKDKDILKYKRRCDHLKR